MNGDDLDPGLRCIAHGCPNAWAVDFGRGRLCSAHDGAPPADWPRVTARELARADERTADASQRSDLRPTFPTSPEATARLVERTRTLLAAAAEVQTSRVWAVRLREREARGEPLSEFRRTAWRIALRVPASTVAADLFETETDEALP